MANSCATEGTIQELLNALETELLELRTLASMTVPRGYAVVAPAMLRAEIERAALTPVEFARIAGVTRRDVEEWLNNRAPVPAWALLAAELAGYLPPSARRKLLRQPLGNTTIPTERTHPFSKIEDL